MKPKNAILVCLCICLRDHFDFIYLLRNIYHLLLVVLHRCLLKN